MCVRLYHGYFEVREDDYMYQTVPLKFWGYARSNEYMVPYYTVDIWGYDWAVNSK